MSKNPGETANPAPFCRALVNVAVDDGAAGKTYRTLELRGSGSDLQVADRPGLIWRDGARFVGLRVVHHQAKGTSTVQWDELEGTDLPNGPAKVWLNTRGGLQPQDAGDGDMPFEETSSLEVTSLIGPYVSAYVASGGYLGGAHDVDDSHYVTLTADGQPVAVADLLDAGARAEVDATIAKAERQRADEGADDEGLPRLDVQAHNVALGWTRSPAGGRRLQALSLLSCCSWAENHNLFALEAPLPETPKNLAETAKLDGAGRFVGTVGCPTIGLDNGALTFADATPWKGPRVLDILGVYWLAEADPDGLLESLPPAAAELLRHGHVRPRLHVLPIPE